MERQNPRPWFSCPESAPRSKDQDLVLQAVQTLHTGLVPALQRLFTKSLGREVEVVMLETSERMVGLYVQSLGKCCWNYCFQMDHRSSLEQPEQRLEGWAHLALSLPLCSALLNPAADGDEVRQRVEAMLATPIGERWASDSDYSVIAKFVKALAPEVEETWGTVSEMSMVDITLQTVPSFIYIDKPTDPAIHIKFEVRSEGYEDLTLSLCYLLSMLEPVLPDLK